MIYKEDNIVSRCLGDLGNCALLIKISNNDLFLYENNTCKIAMY